jgi:hypothetical protein
MIEKYKKYRDFIFNKDFELIKIFLNFLGNFKLSMEYLRKFGNISAYIHTPEDEFDAIFSWTTEPELNLNS